VGFSPSDRTRRSARHAGDLNSYNANITGADDNRPNGSEREQALEKRLNIEMPH